MTKEERLEKMYSDLFDLANEFAVADKGTVAVEIHMACNRLITAMNIVKNGSTIADERRQMQEWFLNQPGLLELMNR